MRICLVFDCLYPYTVGGAERWYRNLAERLAVAGHDVTYLTLRQWERGEKASVPGVEVIAVAPRMQLYTRGRRRVSAQVAFAAGVFWHLLRRRKRYDVVHTPALHVSLVAVAAARPLARFRLFVDWFEVWTRKYWREYLGPVLGWLGWTAQRLSAQTRHHAFCFSQLHAERLRSLGFTGPITVVTGLYAGSTEPPEPIAAEPVVVFAGRHIPEKRVIAVVPAFALAHERAPELRCEIFGDGPDRPELLRQIAQSGLDGLVEAPGFVDGSRVEDTLRRALCMVLPSEREGYGLIVVEAAAAGAPSVVVQGPDNAATELVVDGENGVIAASADPAELAAAILRVREEGAELRAKTASWFRKNARRLSLEGSLEAVLDAYAQRD